MINIGKHMGVEDRPLKPKPITFAKDGKKTIYLTADGRRVKKIQKQPSVYVWLYEDGQPFNGKPFKSINGKPVKEFKKTGTVKPVEVALSELLQVVTNEHTYVLSHDGLKNELKTLREVDKCFSFPFAIRGFKVYKAFAYYDTTHDRVIMRLTAGTLTQQDLTETEREGEKEEGSSVQGLDINACL